MKQSIDIILMGTRSSDFLKPPNPGQRLRNAGKKMSEGRQPVVSLNTRRGLIFKDVI